MDDILVIVDGQVSERGTYKELLAREGAFAEFLKTYFAEHEDSEDEEDEESEFIIKLGKLLLYVYVGWISQMNAYELNLLWIKLIAVSLGQLCSSGQVMAILDHSY